MYNICLQPCSSSNRNIIVTVVQGCIIYVYNLAVVVTEILVTVVQGCIIYVYNLAVVVTEIL